MSSGNIVKLNIGGIIFQTTKSTLTRFDGFFKTMLETDVPLEKDENGAIFIDRPAKHFELILSYMRDGDADIPSYEEDRKDLIKEAQYYLLTDLVKICNSMPKYVKTENVTDVVMRSTKNMVLIVTYWPVTEVGDSMTIARIYEKYGEKLDVYLIKHTQETDDGINWKCYFEDKSTGMRRVSPLAQFENFIKLWMVIHYN